MSVSIISHNSQFGTAGQIFAEDIPDDEQDIETRDFETVKLAEHHETRHLLLC
jgi:hypothetical protein